MIGTVCALVAVWTANPDGLVSFDNRLGTHSLKVVDGEVFHALDGGRFGSVNDETARWRRGGNRLADVVTVAGSGFARLDDVMVLAVDKDGGVWATARLPNGVWLPWGSVTAEAKLPGKAVGVMCESSGRALTVTVRHADGTETTVVRAADGTWGK